MYGDIHRTRHINRQFDILIKPVLHFDIIFDLNQLITS